MNKPRIFKSISLFVVLALLAAGLFVFGTQCALAEARLESNTVNSQLSVHINENAIFGFGWPSGGTDATIKINDPATPMEIDFEAPANWDANNSWYYLQLGDSYTLKPGDVVTLENSALSKSITVVPFAVAEINVTANTVSGVTAPDYFVGVDIAPDWSIRRGMRSDAQGNWMVDFSVPVEQSYDIVPGSVGQAYAVDDDGDTVQVNWRVPNPNINAYLSENRIDTYGWPVGKRLYLTIDGTAYNSDQVATPWQWDPTSGYANFLLANDFTLASGQVIEITDGSTSKLFTVMDLSIESFDRVTKTVRGHSDANTYLGVNLWPTDGWKDVWSDGSGSWQVSYDLATGPIPPWTSGDVTAWDGDGDATIVRINMGHIYTWPGGDNVVIDGVAKYREYTLTIDDPSTDKAIDYDSTILSSPGGFWEECGTVDFPLKGFPLDAGDVITITSDQFMRTLTVAPKGTINFDTSKEIISGNNPGNSYVQVSTPGSWRNVKTGPDGSWSIDYTQTDPVEDINPGMNGGIQLYDDDGDQTGYGWSVPNPWINVHLSENMVESAGWMVGESLEMTITGTETTYTAVTTPCSWDAFCGTARFELGPSFTLEVGQVVTVTNGDITKSMTVMDLYIDVYDPLAKTVAGHGDPGVRVSVDIWSPDGGHLETKADDSGSWLVTFDGPSESFSPFTDGTATGWDKDGNTTVFRINMGNINVWPGGDIVRDGCTLSRTYTLAIEDPDTEKAIDFERTGLCTPYPDGTYSTVRFPLDGFNLDAGDKITVASGHDVRTLVVTPRGRVYFDYENDVISGKNQPNAYVGVWINEGQSWRTIKAGPDGTWSIDYKEPGPNGEPAVDIVRGMSGGVIEYNAVGDNTGYGWYTPFLDVHPQYDLVYALGWNRGDVLTLSIDDLSGNPPADFTATVGDAPWGDPNATAGDFPLQGFDLLPGQILTVSGAGITFTYTIPDPKITTLDVIGDTVSGTGTPGARMQVSPNIPGQWLARNVTVDSAGNWMVSFTPSANPSDSPSSFDLQPGSPVSFSEINEYGDQTWGDDWTIPYPSSGKATGKGSFTSPAGALSSNPGQTGKAVFTFEAKYARNGFDLVGSLRLNFEGFIFQSTGLSWLVVEDSRIQLSGTGTVNATGGYAFMLNAQKGSLGANTIAIRIWNMDTGEVVYDSALGAPDYVPPAIALKDGSFVFTPPQPPAPGSTTITIWNGLAPDQLPAVQRVLAKYRQAHPNVNIVLQPMGDLNAAIANGAAPDLIWWANDIIGSSANNGQIMDLGQLGITDKWLNNTYSPASLSGVRYDGKTWALPESQEGIALVYNKALVPAEYLPASPLNFVDLLAKADAYQKATGKALICNQGFPGGDAYHIAPVFFGFGVSAYVDDAGNAYLNTLEAVNAGNWLQAIKPFSSENNNDCYNEFVNGKVGMWWTGPWALAGLDSAGVDYGIIAMGRPFVGIKALAITTEAKKRGNEFLAADIAKFMTNTSNSISLALANETIPANRAALLDKQVQAIPSVAGFSSAISFGVPMSQSPFAVCQWAPVAKAEETIWDGGDVQGALDAAQEEILSCVSSILNP